MGEFMDNLSRRCLEERIDTALALVRAEVLRATTKHPRGFNSNHEGYAVIQEEVDELWNDVKTDNYVHATIEACHVAAMGVRFMVDRGETVL